MSQLYVEVDFEKPHVFPLHIQARSGPKNKLNAPLGVYEAIEKAHAAVHRQVLLDVLGDVANLQRFVTWKPGKLKADGRVTKPPIGATGYPLKDWDEPENLMTLADALARADRHQGAGIGVAFPVRPEGGKFLCAVDLDKSVTALERDESGAVIKADLEPWAKEIVAQLASYVEISPSGIGLRVLGWTDTPAVNMKSENRELFGTGQYVTLTGWQLGSETALNDITAAIEALRLEWAGAKRIVASRPTTRPFDPSANAALALPELARPEETEENIEAVKAMLAAIPADCDRDRWRKVVWSVLSLDWACGEDLAREWSEQAADVYPDAAAALDDVIRDFDPGGKHGRGIGIGSLVYEAKAAGWTGTLPWQQGTESKTNDPALAWIDDFNKRYSPGMFGNKMVVALRAFDEALRQDRWVLLSYQTFKERHCSDYGTVDYSDKGPVIKAKGAGWLNHPRRVPNREITFDPGQPPALARPGVLNLWTGLAVKTDIKGGTAKPMLDHIREVICRNDPAKTDYIMGWLALLLQRPGDRHEVALVLRGRKGTGKGTLGNLLCRIIGRHALRIQTTKHLVGHFNEHLLDVCFVFADEAFFAGDRSVVGPLNGLITEPTLLIEPKGLSPKVTVNRLSVLMATNSEWVAPMTADERRYAVFDVSDDKAQDHAYFGRLKAWSDRPENLAAFVRHFQDYDLNAFNARRFPETRELAEQRSLSLHKWAQWWGDALTRGSFGGGRWYPVVANTFLWSSYKAYTEHRRMGVYDIESDVSLGKHVKDLVFSWGRINIKDSTSVPRRLAGGWEDGRLEFYPPSGNDGSGRPPGKKVGTLAEARQRFIKHLKLPDDFFEA